MSVYSVKGGWSFLDAISRFVRSADMANLVILVPSVTSANCIRQQVASDVVGCVFLPKILPLQEMSLARETIICADKSRFVGYFENQLLIANLLCQAEGFSTIQSIDMSKAILVLLHEFMKAGKEPRVLEGLHLEHALHLGKLSHFFQVVKDSWLNTLAAMGLSDVTEAFLKSCTKLASILKESKLKSQLLFIGGIEELPTLLLDAILESGTDVILLPASVHIRGQRCLYRESPESYRLIDLANKKGISLIELAPEGKRQPSIVEHYLLANDVRELDFIFRLAAEEHLLGKAVLVVSQDLKFVRSLVKLLNYCGICVKNSLGLELNSTVPSKFLLLISQLFNPAAQVEDLIAFLKHPYFRAEGLDEFERIALGAGLNLALLSESGDFALKHCQRVWQGLLPFLVLLDKEKISFKDLLIEHFEAAERLRPSIWSDFGGASEYLREMVKAAEFLGNISPDDYREIFSRLMLGRYSQPDEPSARLLAVAPEEVIFFKADTVFVPQFHDSNWPKTGDSDIWISDGIRASLGLSNVIERQIVNQRSYFDQILSFPKVIFTRSRRSGDKETTESRFWPESDYFSRVEIKSI